MADYFRGLDSAATIPDAKALVPHFQFALRYLKYTTVSEIGGLLNAGIAVGLIWEHGTTDALGGPEAGASAAQDAIAKARALGAPAGVGIFVAVDMNTANLSKSQFQEVCGYCDSFIAGVVEAGFTGGIYACGDVQLATVDCVPWLAGAMGWAGSHACDNNSWWVIKQGTPTYGGNSWEGINWPRLSFQYDPNVATNLDWAWQPSEPPVAGKPTLRKGDTGDAVAMMQTDLAVPWLVADGNFGPATEDVVKGFQVTKGLTADGIVGPQTWAALDAMTGDSE
jgi:peptidoglycan hydrolase-like protein with peptidoglycan-binding domain